MKLTTSQTSRKASAGCLIFFALPFIGVGVGVSWWCASLYRQHVAMQSWPEVPATITNAELKTHHSKPKRDRDGSTSYEVVATYEYEFNGRKYSSDRVDLMGENGTSELQRRQYAEIKQHLDAKKPFRCYVDPEQPAKSVLYREMPGAALAFSTIFAAAFGSAGIWMLTGAIAKSRRTPPWKPVGVPDDEPWLGRADWATGRIRTSSSAGTTAIVLGIIALYWNFAALPLYRKLFESFGSDPGSWKWLALAFPAVGVLLVVGTIHQFMCHRRFGESVLQLASTPGVIGGQFAGVIHISKRVEAVDGFRVMLSCIETTGSGKQKREFTIYQDECLVMEPMHNAATGATAIPILFAIPFECVETSIAGRRINWRLEASSKMSGVDYQSRFDVPVFKTSESRPDFQLDTSLVETYAKTPNTHSSLAEAGIIKETLPNSIRLDFCMARNVGMAAGLTFVLLIWCGALVYLWRDGSMFMSFVFGLAAVFFAWLVLDQWFHRSVVEASAIELTIRSGLFGAGAIRSIAVDEIDRIAAEDGMASGARVWRNVVVFTLTGQKFTLAKALSSKLAADAVIDELNVAIGRTPASS